MGQLQEALDRAAVYTRKFPKEEFQIIRQNFAEAKPYLYAAIDKAIAEKELLDDQYVLHLYALFFLAEFKDTGVFEKIMEWMELPSDILEMQLGDVITDGLSDIVYHTYNGNAELLKNLIRRQETNIYIRSGMLYVMGQLYLDGRLDRQEWQDFLKELVYAEEEDDEDGIASWLTGVICKCHLIELLPQVRYLFDNKSIDTFIYGGYDNCVDIMFAYDRWDDAFSKSQISADELKKWAMFEQQTEKADREKKAFEKQMKRMQREMQQPVKKVKVGRNDPCPCGSGKKYKQCCLNKPKEAQPPESEQEQRQWLKDYPQTGTERVEGRIYLEDYFDQECIEIDRLIYLALNHRAIPIWNREKDTVVAERKRYYLWEAFSKFETKMEKEGIASTEEYDQKYAIHYMCWEWLGELEELLEESGEKEKYDAVLKYDL